MVVAFMPMHTFSFVLMSALILFYFVCRKSFKIQTYFEFKYICN
jgi:hypothetical protein